MGKIHEIKITFCHICGASLRKIERMLSKSKLFLVHFKFTISLLIQGVVVESRGLNKIEILFVHDKIVFEQKIYHASCSYLVFAFPLSNSINRFPLYPFKTTVRCFVYTWYILEELVHRSFTRSCFKKWI